MAAKGGVPDAWDDDYEAVVDAKQVAPTTYAASPARISRAERKAQHQEANKQLWESAENPQPFHFVEARGGGVALANTDLKPAMKVLSRKPTKHTALENGVKAVKLDDDDVDSEEEERREQAKLLRERQIRAVEERAEKQRKYAERREQLFGPSPSTSTGTATSGRESPARSNGRPKTRGDRRGGGPGRDSPSATSADPSPARPARQLFDPNSSDRVDAAPWERRKNDDSLKPIRNPRGPDGTGRGGFGFAPRSSKNGV